MVRTRSQIRIRAIRDLRLQRHASIVNDRNIDIKETIENVRNSEIDARR
jgi:hypothetical protein